MEDGTDEKVQCEKDFCEGFVKPKTKEQQEEEELKKLAEQYDYDYSDDEEYDEDKFETLDVMKYPLSNLMQLKEVIRTTNTCSVERQNVIGFAFIFHSPVVASVEPKTVGA